MNDTCTFCPAETWSYLTVRDPSDEPPREEHDVPVCIDCLNAFEEEKRT